MHSIAKRCKMYIYILYNLSLSGISKTSKHVTVIDIYRSIQIIRFLSPYVAGFVLFFLKKKTTFSSPSCTSTMGDQWPRRPKSFRQCCRKKHRFSHSGVEIDSQTIEKWLSLGNIFIQSLQICHYHWEYNRKVMNSIEI